MKIVGRWTPDVGPILCWVLTERTVTEDTGLQQSLPPVPGPCLTHVPHPAVGQSLPLTNLGGGVEEQLVIAALVDTPR